MRGAVTHQPGTIAVSWETRVVFIRSHDKDYWYDSRYPSLGRILLHDELVSPEYGYEIIENRMAR